VAKPRI
jgi:serine/threonine-protein kinase SRPK3